MTDIIDEVLSKVKLEDLQVTKENSVSEPELTTKKVEDAIPLLKEIEKNNGYVNIAQTVGLTKSQVELIHQKMNAKISELTPKEEEI